jgi:hypothetical protein
MENGRWKMGMLARRIDLIASTQRLGFSGVAEGGRPSMPHLPFSIFHFPF